MAEFLVAVDKAYLSLCSACANTKEKIDWIKISDSFTPKEKELMEKELILDPLYNVAKTYEKVKKAIESAELIKE